MADSLNELVPALREPIVLVRSDLAREGLDTEIGFTGRNRYEWEQTVKQGATKATSFGASWHSIKSEGAAKTAEGIVLSCACDLWVVSLRNPTTGRPKHFDWAHPSYQRIGEIGEKYGLTWGGRFKNLFDGPHLQAPSLPRPTEEHWAMTPDKLDAFCRAQIAGTKKIRGIA